MGWLITLGILLLLVILPLGVSVKYNAQGALVRLILGPVKITLFPRPPKPKKEKKKKPEKQEKSPEKPVKQIGASEPPKKPEPPKAKEEGGSWTDFLPLVKTALDFLGDFRRKLRLDVLELKLIMAGDDPCDLAVNYGKTWTAVGNLIPALERWFVIKKRNVEVECDFTASETLVTARLDLSITLGRLLSLIAVYGFRGAKEFFNFKKKRKGGAVK